MGTEITLSLNSIDIDWGKNRYWNRHHWLFPPASMRDMDYRYAYDIIEKKPGFETTLGEAHFRLRHLGYSYQESKTKFDSAVARWNRTSDLRLSFEDFHRTLGSVDFASLAPADFGPHTDFREFLLNLLSTWDTDNAGLEDFIADLDVALTLRVLADRRESSTLPLRWHHHDLVENGWAALEDLMDIDRQTTIINHTMLFGRLQDHAGLGTVKAFDNWLATRGLARATSYSKVNAGGAVTRETTTLPTAVRNMIHHPENPHNTLSDDNLRESIELLLLVAKLLPSPLPGLS